MSEKCVDCGAILKKTWREKCYACWKKNQTGNGKHDIRQVIKRLKQKEVVD